MKTSIGISENDSHAVSVILSRLLADEFVLYTKTKNAHWNVEGADFHSMHLFFEQQYNIIDENIDEVAERIRAIGHYAPATLQSYLGLTRLTELIREKNDSHGFIKELHSDHESIIIFLRENINTVSNSHKDVGTGDFLTNLLEAHEKMAWMLRAHL
jgi:starvation-inducible DNA-binding protein